MNSLLTPIKIVLPLFFITLSIHAQLDINSLFALPRATTIEMTSVVSANDGSLVYNTDDNFVY